MTAPSSTEPARKAGPQAGIMLALAACMPIMAILVVAPVLPKIQEAFTDVPNVKALAPIALTVPALMIAILASPMGWLADRVGRKRLLLAALALYTVFGIAPLFLATLPAIIVSRALTGVTEAAIITVCTTLIGDYFIGRQRERYLGLQIGFAGIAAIFFLGIGGALGEHGWRTPFWLYLISILLVIPASLILFEARPQDRSSPQSGASTKFPLAAILGIAAVTLFAGICFYVPIVQNGFLLNAIGVRSSQTIGLVGAAGAVAAMLGTIGFVVLAHLGTHRLLTIAFGLMGSGLLIVSLSPTVPVFVVGGVIAALGSGAVIPTLVNWTLAKLRFEQRGRGVGVYQAAFWLGQFVSPIAVVAIMPAVGGLAHAVTAIAILLVALAVVWAAATFRSWQATASARVAQFE